MNWSKIFVSALALSIFNLFSGVVGFMCFKLFGSDNQIAVQVPISILTGILLVMVWVIYFQRINGLCGGEDYMAVLLFSFFVGAIVFTAAHYLVTGYLTSFGNIGALWAVQFVENMFGLVAGYSVVHRSRQNQSEKLKESEV